MPTHSPNHSTWIPPLGRTYSSLITHHHTLPTVFSVLSGLLTHKVSANFFNSSSPIMSSSISLPPRDQRLQSPWRSGMRAAVLTLPDYLSFLFDVLAVVDAFLGRFIAPIDCLLNRLLGHQQVPGLSSLLGDITSLYIYSSLHLRARDAVR